MDQFPNPLRAARPLPWDWTSWACRTAVRRSRAGSGRGGCRRRGRRAGGAPPPPPPPPSSPHPGPRSHPPFRCSSPCCRNSNHYEEPAYRIADPDPYLFTSVLSIRDILVRILGSIFHTTDLRIQLRSTVAFKMPKINKNFPKFYCLLLFKGTVH